MNWTDFMIAIRQGLIQPVESEMLTTSILEKALTLSQGTYEYDLGGSGYTGTDLPNSNYKYSKATVLTKGKGGRATVILWGLKVGETLIPPTFNLYDNGAWSGWNDYVVKSDLAKYLPLTGGEINGNISQVKYLSTDYVYRRIQNPARAVFERLAPNGQYWLYDETNGKYILESLVDGTNTFNGTASGNLPLDGGGTINGANATPLVLNNKDNTSSTSMLRFSTAKIGEAGSIGFSGVDNPIVRLSSGMQTLLHTGNMANHVLPLDGGGKVTRGDVNPLVLNSTSTETDEIIRIPFQKNSVTKGYLGFVGTKPMFTAPNYNTYELHHNGNSAKVHIGTTAPLDTSSLWIDTSA